MTHPIDLIATLALGFALAFVFGFAAVQIRIPPLVGYLVAGIVIGPATPGFVADQALANQLAEVGVILLMFGVGLHFSFRELMVVGHIAFPGAVVQILVATALGVGMTTLWGWSLSAGLTLGLALSVASTVVLLRALAVNGMLDSPNGHIAVGWLIVEDLVMVVVLVLLPALAAAAGADRSGGDLLATLALTIGKVVLFVGLMLVIGKRIVGWLLERVAYTGLRELFTLAIIAAALGIAYAASELFGVSLALGAFFAGLIISESDLSHRAAAEATPLQDAFAVLFFVSVGMLFDPQVLIEQPLQVAAALSIVLVGKSVAALLIVLAFNYPLRTALTVAVSLAQIGEFSFILAGLGITLGLLPAEGQDLILAAALLSISLNPFIFQMLLPMQTWLHQHPGICLKLERRNAALAHPNIDERPCLSGHAVLVGYGRVGKHIGEALRQHGLPYVVVEYNRALVRALRVQGVVAIYGDAAMPGLLEHAMIEHARLLVVTVPEALQAREIVELARQLKPDIDTIVATHSERDLAWLDRHKVGLAVMGERELAASMTRYVLRCFGVDVQEAKAVAAELRRRAKGGTAAIAEDE